VFGIPSEQFGEQVQAVIQPANWKVFESQGSDSFAMELKTWCEQRLSKIKLPKNFDFMAKLPRENNGKLYKTKLRESYL